MEHLAWMEKQDTSYKTKLLTTQKLMDEWRENLSKRNLPSDTEYTIPIVVHVVWNTAAEKISVAQVESEIPVINAAYNRQNADTVNTPAPFKSIAANMHITFCLASTDPNGNPTNGIVYKQTSAAGFYYGFNTVKYPSLGGDTVWDVNRYLNIWVCNLQGGALGFSEFPTSPLNNTFGSVILYQAFGTTGTLLVPYNLGGTAAHEIGHLLNLHHLWGDDGGLCPGQNGGQDDGAADTPPEGNSNSDTYTNFGNSNGATYGCPTFPYTDNCSSTYPGIMFNNYMEYTDDSCYNLFTNDQKSIAMAALHVPLAKLITSNTCGPTGINEYSFTNGISISPNPSSGQFTIHFAQELPDDCTIDIYSVLGEKIYSTTIRSSTEINMSSYTNGIYLLRISGNNVASVKKIILSK